MGSRCPGARRGDRCGAAVLTVNGGRFAWSSRRAAARLGVDDSRLARWQQRRECGELTDRAPGGAPLHGLLAAERARDPDVVPDLG